MPTIHFPPPQVSLDDAARIAREEFGLAGIVSRLPGERDLNFKITADAGAFVLKVANAEEVRGTLELQHAALEHLARVEPGLGLQRPLAARSGETIVTVESTAGERHLCRVLTFLPGRLWADVRPHSMALVESLGGVLGAIDRGLAGFDPPGARRELKWDLRQAGWARDYLRHVEGDARRALAERWLDAFDRDLAPALATLRQRVVYNDANDHNVVVAGPPAERRVAGVIDFGDLCHSALVCEPAIAAAYAAMGLPDPVAAIARLVAGYHREQPLEAAELEILHPLVCLRLAVSVVNSAYQRQVEPDNEYLLISERAAWPLLEQLSTISPVFARSAYRAACGLPAHPDSPRLVRWLAEHRDEIGGVVAADLSTAKLIRVDWSAGSRELGPPEELADGEAMAARIDRQIEAAGATAAVGAYGEARAVYASDAFHRRGNDREEQRSVHLGVDLFLPAGSAIRAPLEGVVASFADNAAPFDYGPTIVLAHEVEDSEGPLRFFTLYGHLSRESLAGLAVGRRFARGERLATLGEPAVNGGWAPHLHLQLIVDLLGGEGDFIGACLPSERAIWRDLCPDPAPLAHLPAGHAVDEHDADDLLARRRARLGANLSLSYREPLHLVRGYRQWLWDADGQRFLDAFNNVPHVGHSHPRVVRAVAEQLALLNTNTRYLDEGLVRYAERLTARLPSPLSVGYFTASGSEANELALRLARAHAGARDLVVMAGAYHGHTTTLVDVSPYKHDGPGGEGAPDWVHVAPVPDIFRGAHRGDDPLAGARYAEHVATIAERLRCEGRPLAGFLAETFPSVGGQIVPPDGYYPAVYAAVRAAGGVCIADEVQTGFGRTGDTFWAFERYGVVPDVVVLGKPIANGYPMGAVVTTPEIAASFDNGMEFFSTFGGSTAAIAAAMATLDVIEAESLQENAKEVGAHLLGRLRQLAPRHQAVGDVRGAGLFVGVELVRDRATLEPATAEAAYVADRMRDRGVLIGTDGPFHNVLKIRPPLCFTAADADRLADTLDEILAEDGARAARG